MTLIVLPFIGVSRVRLVSLDNVRDSCSFEALCTVRGELAGMKLGLVRFALSHFSNDLFSNGPILASFTFSSTNALTSSFSLIGLSLGWLELSCESEPLPRVLRESCLAGNLTYGENDSIDSAESYLLSRRPASLGSITSFKLLRISK